MNGTLITWIIFSVIFALILAWGAWRRVIKRATKPSIELFDAPLAHSFGRAISDLSFEDAIDTNRSSLIVKEKLIGEINTVVDLVGTDGFVVGLEVVRGVQARDLILAQFPEAITRKLKDGSVVQATTKSGEKLLIAADKTGRKFIAHAKQVDPSLVAKMSQAATLIVGAAHIIAGYDNAKKLKSLDAKIDRILTGMKIQRIAKLAEVYETFKSDLLRKSSDRSEWRDLQRSLRELRNIWLGEIRDNLSGIQNPKERSRWSKWFSRNKVTADNLKNQVKECSESLHYVRFILQLEQVISEILGQRMIFEDVTVSEIRGQISALVDLVNERKAWIRELDKEALGKELIIIYENFEESLRSEELGDQKSSKRTV